MVRALETGSTIFCLRPALPDHARMAVMLLRKSYSDMCRDGSNTAYVQSHSPVAEPGRVHGVPDIECFADPRGSAWKIGPFTAMKEKWRWRILARNRPQIVRPNKTAR